MSTRSACYLVSVCLLLLGGVAKAIEPCCNITAVNARTGIVTARDATTKGIVYFKAPTALLRSLRIGQRIDADYGTGKVSVNGAIPCCAIVNVRPAEPVSQPRASADVRPAEPVGQPKAAADVDRAEPVGQPSATLDVTPAEPVGEPEASAQAISSATARNPLAGKRGLPPIRAGRATENPGRQECAARGGEWRCTTISTGSDPGPGDDLQSCACINP